MNLVIITHKETWLSEQVDNEYVTTGGFPFQIRALTNLFDQTTLVATLRNTPSPEGATSLAGQNLFIHLLPEPRGTDLHRKLALFSWLPRHLSALWQAVREADAVHALVPGDIGTLGILIALTQRKPLFVRHCGTWNDHSTLANRFLSLLLPYIARGHNLVLATGGAALPPVPGNRNVAWIFSTTLTDAEWEHLTQAESWQPGKPLRMIFVGRLSPDKNTAVAIQTLARLQELGCDAYLDVVGSGEMLFSLNKMVKDLKLENQVTFYGNVSHGQVLTILAKAHLFIFPTRTKEGFPKALLEAMACGLPIVSTNISVIPRLIKDCGITLNDSDPESFAQAILTLMNSGQMVMMAKSARLASRGFTLEMWQKQIREHLEVVWGLCQGLH